MRILTIVMAIMAPGTLIASIYGMNIHLPGGLSSAREITFWTFGIVLFIMFGIAAAMLWFFRRRHWI
jgi:Mg2+ and Co2+ transporter CorA